MFDEVSSIAQSRTFLDVFSTVVTVVLSVVYNSVLPSP